MKLLTIHLFALGLIGGYSKDTAAVVPSSYFIIFLLSVHFVKVGCYFSRTVFFFV